MVGLPQDSVWAGVCRRAGARFVDKVGQTSLAELVEMLKNSALCIANDSGVAHLSGLEGCPCLVLFGPGDPRYVAPRGKDAQIIRDTTLPCSPCESAFCHATYGYQRCLKNVEVEMVLEKALPHLSPAAMQPSNL